VGALALGVVFAIVGLGFKIKIDRKRADEAKRAAERDARIARFKANHIRFGEYTVIVPEDRVAEAKNIWNNQPKDESKYVIREAFWKAGFYVLENN
jgi:hypothetical protein